MDSGTPCHFKSYGVNLKFCGRMVGIDELKAALDPGDQDQTLKVMSICSLGGVGKTQLALHYANTSRGFYDTISWAQADTQTKLVQSLSNFTSKLSLPKKEGSGNDEYQSIQKVKDWLDNSGKTFLLDV